MTFHGEHYRPDNALLYVVGDVDPADVQARIKEAFAGVPKPPSPRLAPPCLKAQSRHFPPVVHEWSGGAYDGRADVPLSGGAVLETTDDDRKKYLLPLDVPAVPHPATGVPAPARAGSLL